MGDEGAEDEGVGVSAVHLTYGIVSNSDSTSVECVKHLKYL